MALLCLVQILSTTQNDLLLKNLLEWYNKDDNLNKMLSIINVNQLFPLRIVDWLPLIAKKNFTVYNIVKKEQPYVLKFILIIN